MSRKASQSRPDSSEEAEKHIILKYRLPAVKKQAVFCAAAVQFPGGGTRSTAAENNCIEKMSVV